MPHTLNNVDEQGQLARALRAGLHTTSPFADERSLADAVMHVAAALDRIAHALETHGEVEEVDHRRRAA